MQYMMWICNNVTVNIYWAESNMQDARDTCSKVKDKFWITYKFWLMQTTQTSFLLVKSIVSTLSN